MPVLTTLGAATAKAWGFLQQVAAAADPYFNYVTMLLTGNGTNGAQNNTFLDSSSNAFSITRNGNTTQGSFSPYGSLWSNYFSSSYFTLADNAAWAFGSGDFTIEGWFFGTSNSGAGQYLAIQSDNSSPAGSAWQLLINGSTPTIDVYSGGSYYEAAGGTFTFNQWNHIAAVRSGSTMSLYLNGTRVGTVSVGSASLNDSSQTVGISGRNNGGDKFTGYISNLRIVKGTAVYDATASTLTVPTTPLTAISGTSLLTCQSNRFIDNSSNAFALTINGTPSVQRFSPFNPTASYDTATIGGSGYFDGSGDYLQVATNSNVYFGTGDFTIEGWYYYDNPATTVGTLFSMDANYYINNGIQLRCGNHTSGDSFYINGNYWNWYGQTYFLSYRWNHVAVVRSGSTVSIYVNGTSVFSTTYSGAINPATPTRLGAPTNNTSDLYKGYISNFRIVVGTAVYTSNFTPNTSPLTAVSGTQMLVNMINAGIPDSAMMNDLETVGNAQVSTTQSKFGTASIKFDGTGDYLLSKLPTTNLCAFGTGNFTIEFWLYLSSTSGYQVIYDSRNGTTGAYNTIYLNGATLVYEANNAAQITAGSNLSTSTWYHIALCRSGTSTKLFINGTQTGSTYTDSTNYLCDSNRPVIGADGANTANNNLNGYIDDLRVTKGYARYTSNFTAPTAAFPTY